MNYFESYRYLFRSPKWPANLLISAVGFLVPIAGPMVILGYQFDILEALHLRGRETYPDFDTNRLGRYLVRGAWPFLVQLIVGMILGIVPGILLGVCYIGFWVSLMTAMPPPGAAGGAPAPAAGGSMSWVAVWGALLAASVLLVLVVQLVAHVILVPMILRAGLMQDFAAGFSWTFIRDFLGRVWGRTLLAGLFIFVTAIPLTFLGLLLCFFGLYPAASWVQFAETFLLYELYEEYLKRGGTEIPLKVESVRQPTLLEAEE